MFYSSSFKEKGFTFSELLVVIGILVVLVAISAPAFHFFQRESDLNNSSEEITSTLRRAQTKTIASEGASQHGVYFDSSTFPHRYTLFRGADYVSRDISFDEIRKLPKGVEIYEINLDGGNEVVFDRVAGTTAQSGNVSLRLETDPTETRVIYIESSGLVGTSIPSVPTNGRIEDSRHVHFGYNQNAQTAVTLHLVFPDYPSDNYDISFQGYLSVDKSEFSWEGVISVGPDGSKTEQRLKIHTHSLTSTVAQFCVHRPLSPNQSYNDKALNIFLDGEELIKYAADERGTTTKGSSIWVGGEPELQ